MKDWFSIIMGNATWAFLFLSSCPLPDQSCSVFLFATGNTQHLETLQPGGHPVYFLFQNQQ